MTEHDETCSASDSASDAHRQRGDVDRVMCPICRVPGEEKKQKWFCPRCGQLLQTCCD